MNDGKSTQLAPGRAFGIWAFVLAFVFPALGLIFGLIAVAQSRRAGVSNRLGVAGVVISIAVITSAVITTIALASAGKFTAQ